MTKIESIKNIAKMIVEKDGFSLDDFDMLIDKAKNEEDFLLYANIYNYVLGKRQQEVIANERY